MYHINAICFMPSSNPIVTNTSKVVITCDYIKSIVYGWSAHLPIQSLWIVPLLNSYFSLLTVLFGAASSLFTTVYIKTWYFKTWKHRRTQETGKQEEGKKTQRGEEGNIITCLELHLQPTLNMLQTYIS